jgi:hypothetical protein
MKHIISIILLLFLGFSPKSVAQTYHTVKLSYKACFEKTFTIQYAVTADSIVPTIFKPKKLEDIFVPEGGYLHLKFDTISTNTNILNGANTFDMVLIAKHLIQTQLITDKASLFAADINNSGDVTVADMIEFRLLIYGLQRKFANNKPWRPFSTDKNSGSKNDIFTFFIDKDETLKFIPIKIGDINGNASCN